MFVREIKVNFKSFLIWTLILMSLFFIVFLMYPSIMSSENVQMMNEMLKIFPEEMLKAFNMDISNIDTAFGWLKTEGFVFVLLITGIYSGILGSNILLKEENDKTIEFLLTKPISRRQVFFAKVFAGLIYLFFFSVLLAITNGIGLLYNHDFQVQQWFSLTIGSFLLHVFFFFLTLFLSQFFRKTSKAIGICFGTVVGSYFLQVISRLSNQVEFLKYFSPFEYVDSKTIIENGFLSIPHIIVLSIGFLVVLFYTEYLYQKKEFY